MSCYTYNSFNVDYKKKKSTLERYTGYPVSIYVLNLEGDSPPG